MTLPNTRRTFLKTMSLGTISLPFLVPRSPMHAQHFTVYVGTYTSGESEGIYRCRLNLETGAIDLEGLATATEEPSFLAIHPNQRFLYAVNELMTFDEQPGGAVSAFAIDPQTGDLTFLNQQPTHGGAPCHLSIDQTGAWLLVANYMGGNATVLPIQDSGRLGQPTDVVQHEGKGSNPQRQEAPHAHSVTLDATNQFAFVADLGIDKMMAYRLDLDHGKLTPLGVPSTALHAGAGPRHFAFHPSNAFAYVINELDATITAFSYDREQGTLREIQTVPTLPEGYDGNNSCADLHVSPDGRFLYGSNRGHDSIVIFAISKETGMLSYVDHESTQGRTPRNFAIDPTGTMLLAANQQSDSIVTFHIDVQTGKLTPTGHSLEVPAPVCLKLMAT